MDNVDIELVNYYTFVGITLDNELKYSLSRVIPTISICYALNYRQLYIFFLNYPFST